MTILRMREKIGRHIESDKSLKQGNLVLVNSKKKGSTH